jgi:hypothetical protein
MAEKNERKEAHAQNSTVPPYTREGTVTEKRSSILRVWLLFTVFTVSSPKDKLYDVRTLWIAESCCCEIPRLLWPYQITVGL